MNKEICCPKFDPTPWDGTTHQWDSKRFVKDKVFCLFNMPLNFGSVIKRLTAKVEAADAKSQDWMGLSDHTSKFNMDLYLAVDKEVPGAENVTITGNLISKVYEGPFQDTGKWCKDFDAFIKEKNLEYKKMYMWYTTCPKCAKEQGNNYVVILGELK